MQILQILKEKLAVYIESSQEIYNSPWQFLTDGKADISNCIVALLPKSVCTSTHIWSFTVLLHYTNSKAWWNYVY